MSRSRPLACLTLAACSFAALTGLTGCGPGGPLAIDLGPRVERPAPRAVLFICDGLSVDRMREWAAEGSLPNVKRYLLDRGTQVETALTGVPSITYAALTTFATGTSRARHGVIANEWFDRSTCLCRTYIDMNTYRAVDSDFTFPTIYERLRPRQSVTIQTPLARGATQHFDNWAASGVMWYFGDFTAVDKMAASTVETAALWANFKGRWPQLLTCYFPGVDTVGHRSGLDSPRYRYAVEHFDHQLGRICDWIERQGMLHDTYLVLVSDHGLVNVAEDHYEPLMPYLRDVLGRRVTDSPVQWPWQADRERFFAGFDAVCVKSAKRFAALYLRAEGPWAERPSAEAVRAWLDSAPAGQRIWDLPAVDFAALRLSDHEVALVSRSGEAHLMSRGRPGAEEFSYTPVTADVLEYVADADTSRLVFGGFHRSRTWLDATADTAYPDLVPQLTPLLSSMRSGDVLLFAAPGYSFARERSGHGGVDRDELRIPMVFAGPGIKPGGIIPTARAVDLMPTLLALLGDRMPSDGVSEGIALLPGPMNAEYCAAP